jgi:hypothetical protein
MRVYEPVSERDGPFVKIINSRQFIVNSIWGYLPLKVSFFEHLHRALRWLWLFVLYQSLLGNCTSA